MTFNLSPVLLIVRTYALFNRNKRVLAGLVTWSLALVIVSGRSHQSALARTENLLPEGNLGGGKFEGEAYVGVL